MNSETKEFWVSQRTAIQSELRELHANVLGLQTELRTLETENTALRAERPVLFERGAREMREQAASAFAEASKPPGDLRDIRSLRTVVAAIMRIPLPEYTDLQPGASGRLKDLGRGWVAVDVSPPTDDENRGAPATGAVEDGAKACMSPSSARHSGSPASEDGRSADGHTVDSKSASGAGHLSAPTGMCPSCRSYSCKCMSDGVLRLRTRDAEVPTREDGMPMRIPASASPSTPCLCSCGQCGPGEDVEHCGKPACRAQTRDALDAARKEIMRLQEHNTRATAIHKRGRARLKRLGESYAELRAALDEGKTDAE